MTDPNQAVLFEVEDGIARITLNRPEKRNAFSQTVFEGIRSAIDKLTPDIKAVVLSGNGDHFCAGLDLAEHKEATPFESVLASREGHRLFGDLQNCGRPVISAMHGAVIGGGLELVCSTHIRVAETNCFYQLPEGRRGIFVGGGASVRVAKVIGVSRLIEMMLTGRKLDAAEGERIGLSHYTVERGQGIGKAMEIARNVAGNAQISNYMMLQALAHIEQMPDGAGFFTESLAQALTLTSGDAKAGIDAFLQKKNIDFNKR